MNKRNPANDRQAQQKLRDRRKELGWKRVTIWLDPNELSELEKHDPNWLGTTVKMLLKTGLSDKQQDSTINGQDVSDKQTISIIEQAPIAIDNAAGAGQILPMVDSELLPCGNSADDAPVKIKRVRYSDEICLMIFRMKEGGASDDAIAGAVKTALGKDLPASFNSNVSKLVKRGKELTTAGAGNDLQL